MSSVFELVVRGPSGQVRSIEQRAPDAAAARAAAVRGGLHVIACDVRPGLTLQRMTPRLSGGKSLDVAIFSQELAALIGAGLPITEALHTLADKEKPGAQRDLLGEVIRAVSEGLPLSAAMQQREGRFPPLLVATVASSEQTGDLATALRRYADHQRELRALRDKVVGSAVYPMLLLAVGGVVVMFLLGVVVPKFATLIESTHRELPWTSALLMSWGRFASLHGWSVAVGAAALALGAVTGARHVWRDGARSRWIEALPMIGPTVRQFRHAQLYRTSGMLVQGGIPALRALALAADVLGDEDRARLQRALELIQQGQSISAALGAAQLGDSVATSMLTVAERTGELAQILERIAQFYEARLQRSIDLTSRLFEPALMVFIGLVIGAIVVLMYLPIFDLASSLQ